MGSEVGEEARATVCAGVTSSLGDEALSVLASSARCIARVAEFSVFAGIAAGAGVVDNELLSTSALVAAKGTFNKIVGSSVTSLAGLR